jgi:PKD repeat protein
MGKRIIFISITLIISLLYPVSAYVAPNGETYDYYYTISGEVPLDYYDDDTDYFPIELFSSTDWYVSCDLVANRVLKTDRASLRITANMPSTGEGGSLSDAFSTSWDMLHRVSLGPERYSVTLTSQNVEKTIGISYNSGTGQTKGYSDGVLRDSSTTEFWGTSQVFLSFDHLYGDTSGWRFENLQVWVNGGVFPEPIAGFHAAPTSGDEPLTVKFYDDSDYGDYWIWFFGDNWYLEYDTDNWQYAAGGPEHTYHEPGSYTVKQCVQNAYGEDWENKTSYITVGEQYGTNITAQFTADPLSGGKPLTVKFYDQSVGDDINLWRWYFGDDYYTEYDTDNWEYSAGGPEHTYHDSGYFDVTLMVRNSTDEDWEVKTNYITVYETGPPNADWFAVPESGPAPLDVSFWDTSSGNPTNFYWDYGDGWWTQYDTDDVMYDAGGTWHTYNSPGTYLVNLTVSSPYGSDSKSDYITVTSPANGTFAITAIDSQTNALIHSAHIEVTGAGETWYDDDFDGTITMDLPLGTNYGITVSSSGYYDQVFQYTLTANKQMTVALVRTGTAEEGYSSIDFIVKESITNNPVRAATVTFSDTWTLTDDYGSAHFTVSNTSGNLEWVVSKTGYYPEQGTVDTSTSQTVQVSLVVQPPPTTLTPTPTPSQPGNVSATPTPDTRTPEEKVNDAASIWINGAEFISGLLFLAVIFGIVDLFGGRRRGRR